MQDAEEREHEGRDPPREQAAGRVRRLQRHHRPGPPPDRRGGRTERRQEQRPRELCGQRLPPPRIRHRYQETAQ